MIKNDSTVPSFKTNLIFFTGSTVLMLLVYAPILIWMWDRWFARDSYYSHGILIPFFSGYLIWQNREELKKIVCKESRLGLILIIAGLGVHFISSLLRIYFSSGFSMLIVLAGLILHFFGREFFRKILFPVSFLVFMIPVPIVLIGKISFQLKTFAAEIATGVLNNIRIPAIREGSMIRMRHAQVIVDDVCSGLRSLISLTALGSIVAYWMQTVFTKRVVLFLLTIPIAIVTNVVRILILAVISELWGPKYAVGFIHDASGFLVFALAFIMLYVAKELLEE